MSVRRTAFGNEFCSTEETITPLLKNSLEHIHLLGIGGAAMAPVAGMLRERGYTVTGSDANVYPPASTLLSSLSIPWKEGFHPDNLRPPPDLIVVGNAISRGNPELEAALDARIPYWSMPQTLEELFLPDHSPIVIAGTHGKTTTTAMLAWIFHAAGRRPDFLVGGVVPNFGERSYGLGGGEEFIIEGDEYDSAYFDKQPKFLHYHPEQLILTSLEFDHADIYENLAAIELQFRRLVNLVPRKGRIFVWGEAENLIACTKKAFCPVVTYGLTPKMDWCAGDIEWRDGMTHFRVLHHGCEAARVRMALVGRHNVMNALACIALSLERGVERGAIEDALARFESVRKRMEIKGEVDGVIIVEDFAHHPTAIRATVEAARSRWPGKRLWAAFEPRSNTMRRKIFADALVEALALADGTLLGPVNRSQLLSDEERLDPKQIAAKIRSRGSTAEAFGSSAEIADYLADRLKPGDVVLVMSNGSFDGLSGKLIEVLRKRAVAPQA
ncbi:MAG TPA: UDP-N-acetylmuramate:L-alanyl-gamma-D-glutamyl-meso-diaminopimelate ligase [Candidatus Acidoferrales bacterium]|nr:UDP-N-acetylmuramate:L-alanyl-gamma-D-glutamyl-meso-diaminopimelate ligase [Candidatus Acidoferrales bacterium]